MVPRSAEGPTLVCSSCDDLSYSNIFVELQGDVDDDYDSIVLSSSVAKYLLLRIVSISFIVLALRYASDAELEHAVPLACSSHTVIRLPFRYGLVLASRPAHIICQAALTLAQVHRETSIIMFRRSG